MQPTGNANGRPSKTQISATIERSERNRIANESALNQERMQHERAMAKELAQEEREREVLRDERAQKNNLELMAMMLNFMGNRGGGN